MADAPLRPRPLSPHLTIYRLTWTMAMSMAHRLSGIALYFGMLLLAWWLVAAALSPKHFDNANDFFGSWFGRLILFGFTSALVHHLLGGLRHFIWDTVRGFGAAERHFLAQATLLGSTALNILIWAVALMLKN